MSWRRKADGRVSGWDPVWIEKCLAHEDGRSSRGVYNKAEYEVQRRHMVLLIPPSMPLFEPDPAIEPGVIAAA
jgi:hypothetical protein